MLARFDVPGKLPASRTYEVGLSDPGLHDRVTVPPLAETTDNPEGAEGDVHGPGGPDPTTKRTSLDGTLAEEAPSSASTLM